MLRQLLRANCICSKSKNFVVCIKNGGKNSIMMLKSRKANLRNPFLINLRTLAYRNSQMERTKYLSFLKALNHC